MPNQPKAFSESTRRYVGALLTLADEKGEIDDVAKDMAIFADFMKKSEDLRAVLTNPLLKREQVAASLAALLSKADVGQLTKKFVGLVVKKGRAKELPLMTAAFATSLAARRGEFMAEVTSARALSKDQETSLQEALVREMGSKVQINQRVDPSILGGLIIRVGSKMIDSSLRTKLQKLKLSLSKGLTTKGIA